MFYIDKNKVVVVGGVGVLASLLATSSVHAQDAFSIDSPWMLGSWDGQRNALQEKGYSFDLSYVSEMATNARGGYDQNGKLGYADQFSFGVNVDLQKAIGISDADFQLTVTNRNGYDFSSHRLTDPRTGPVGSTMEVAGRGQIWRLTQMWYRQNFQDGKITWKFGRTSPTEDFQEFPCDFQNLSFCSAQAGVWAGDDWYSYPVSQWGTSLKVAIAPEFSLHLGVYEHNRSELDNHNGFKLSTSGANGVVLPVELVWSPKSALFGRPGEYRVGAYRINMNANDLYEDVNGNPRVLTDAEAKSRSHRSGTWIMARQEIAGEAGRPVEMFAQAHFNDRDTSFVDRFYSLGLLSTGPFASRPHDQIGFAVGRARVNSKIRSNERLLNQINSASSYDDPNFTPQQTSEYMAELYYGIQAANWLTLRPNVQYLHRPGGVKEVDDAIVLGLKTVIVF